MNYSLPRASPRRASRDFGIKDQQTNLVSFAGDAYLNELGISTQSCYKGTSILAFATDNQSNNVAPKAGCNNGDLAPAHPAGDPQVPQVTDDAVGDCVAGQSEVQEDVANFLFFMERMAPPPPDLSDPISTAIGAIDFGIAGCTDCHASVPFITPLAPFNGDPRPRRPRPRGAQRVRREEHDGPELPDQVRQLDLVAVSTSLRWPGPPAAFAGGYPGRPPVGVRGRRAGARCSRGRRVCHTTR